MRVHVAPAFGVGEPHPQCLWIRELSARSGVGRFSLVDEPDEADAILLTDVGVEVTHVRFRRKLLRLLTHPLVRRYRRRCFLYHEHDVPRPYLPGLYYNMEWFPGVDRMAAAVASGRMLEPSPNPYMDDAAPPAEPDLLFSFMGRNCHALRDALLTASFDRDDVLLVDTSELYDHYEPDRDTSMQRDFVAVMRRSRWALCPRGWSAASPRVFEAMRLGIAPVVLCDNWLRPSGPDWEKCCLWIPESDLPDLPAILEAAGDAWVEMGLAAQRAYRECFAGERVFIHMMATLEGLLQRWQRESMPVHAVRRAREVAVHAIGFTSPPMTRSRRSGDTAIARRSGGSPHAG